MRKSLIFAGVVTFWLQAATGWAQFGQNQVAAPPGARLLPNSGGGYVGKQGFPPGGYGGFNGYGGYNNFNGGYGANTPFNSGFNNSYGSPYGNPWQGNPWQANPWQANPWAGGGFNSPLQNPWNGNNYYGAGAPFGGYQTGGYGNYAPIVGINNGWYPYQPAYDPNSPVNQALQKLYIQGLTGSLK